MLVRVLMDPRVSHVSDLVKHMVSFNLPENNCSVPSFYNVVGLSELF